VSANLDLVCSIFADWERGDFGSVQSADSEIEYVWNDGPSPRTSRGRAAAVEVFRDFLDAWEDYRVEAEEYRELDSERVLVPCRSSARGKTSGLELGQTQAKAVAVFHVRDGKVRRLVTYWDRERALGDLRLFPEGDLNRDVFVCSELCSIDWHGIALEHGGSLKS
jgi:ketosteroid isomerase-like protein